MNILIVEDNIELLPILEGYLQKEGFDTFIATNGQDALDIFYEQEIDLAIVDWMLPKKNGIDVIKQMRQTMSTIRIIMLTAKTLDTDELFALGIGADDFVKKPFNPNVLVMRVKKLLQFDEIYEFANLKYNMNSRTLSIDDELISLTKTEHDVIQTLVRHRGQILTREQLLNIVWGMDYFGDIRVVDTNIKRIRDKTKQDFIQTKRGVGYIIL